MIYYGYKNLTIWLWHQRFLLCSSEYIFTRSCI